MIQNDWDRFWSKVDKTSTCWIWTAGKDKDGYGMFWLNKLMSNVRPHRVIAKYLLGLDIEGKQVCHKCDNPTYVNPKHLFVGTPQDNIDDMKSKGRGIAGGSSRYS